MISWTQDFLCWFFSKPHSHPDWFCWGHQCSWTLTPANTEQVSIMQSVRTWLGLRRGLNLPRPRSLGWMRSNWFSLLLSKALWWMNRGTRYISWYLYANFMELFTLYLIVRNKHSNLRGFWVPGKPDFDHKNHSWTFIARQTHTGLGTGMGLSFYLLFYP